MANYCSNCVQFECSPETLVDIKALFSDLAAKEKETERGQLPDFIQAERGFMSEIYWNEGIFHYETRWCPNIEVMTAIADYFKAGFTLTYDEISNLVYGQAEYKYGVLTDIYLELAEFEAYTYDEDKEVYLFEGQEYEIDYEILEILLERKKYQLEHTDCIKN